jgi:hypothetical protein
MTHLDRLRRLSPEGKKGGGVVLPKPTEPGFVSFAGSDGHTFPTCGCSPSLAVRIRLMAARWHYTHDELQKALTGAQSDPQGWMAWTERDERDFGGCVTHEDFREAYIRARRLT